MRAAAVDAGRDGSGGPTEPRLLRPKTTARSPHPAGAAGLLLPEGEGNARPPSAPNVYRASVRTCSGFPSAFSAASWNASLWRRVGVDRAGDVLEPRAHFDRQRKGRRQFGDAGADGMDAEHDMVVGPRRDPDEPLVGLPGHRPAVGAEGEKARQNLAVRRLGRLGRQADGDDLRVGEADRRESRGGRRRASRRR